MSSSINRVVLLGNLGADPDKIRDGIALRLATSRRWMDDGGARQERTDWHRVVLFGKRAAALATMLRKGSRIAITGEMRSSEYTDKDGAKRYGVDVFADDVVLLDPAPEGRQGRRSAPRDEADDAPGGMQ